MATDDHELERIRTLLAKAERAGTQRTADAYNTRAAELMARHSVDSAVRAAEHDVVESRRIPLDGLYSTERATLIGGIATTMNCRAVTQPRPRRGQVGSVTLIGSRSDLERVETAYTSLLAQAIRSVARQLPFEQYGESTVSYRGTWLIGFSAEVHERFSAATRRAAADHDAVQQRLRDGGRSAQRALADRRNQIDGVVANLFPELRRRQRHVLDGGGDGVERRAGRRAGVDDRAGGSRPDLGLGSA